MIPRNILQPEGPWILLESVRKNRLVFQLISRITCLLLHSYFLMMINFFQDAIFRVIAAILHLGNIEFAKGEEVDSSVIKDEKSRFHLNMTAELFKYDLIVRFFFFFFFFCVG